MARKAIPWVVFVAVLVVLWVLPLVFFANPGTNDSIWLANLELLLILVGWVGLMVAVARSGQRRSHVCIELGVFVVGAGLALVLGLAVFGNTSNDRFLPLIFLPPLIAAPGLLLILIGVLLRGDAGSRLRAAAYGLVGAAFVAVWILFRGSRDWLLAPYGFDELAAIVVVGVALASVRPVVHG